MTGVSEEERAKRGLGEAVWYLLKHRFTWQLVLGGAAVFGWLRPTQPKPEDVYWNEEELQTIVENGIQKAVLPLEERSKKLEAGFRALVKHSDAPTRAEVFQAMDEVTRAKN